MKKTVALLLALVTVFLLVGCNTGKAELSRGTIEGNVYKNEYLGIQFTKPDSWVYSTDEEIAAVTNMGAELLGENFKEALDNNPSVYDMMVVDSITRNNINIGYENLAKTLSSNITEEQYVEALKRQLENISAISVTFPDTYDTVKLGETEFTRVICSTASYGVKMTQVYYLHKIEGYMAFIIVTIQDGDSVADIEAMFK